MISLLTLIYQDPGSWSLFWEVIREGPGLTFEEWGLMLLFGRVLWVAIVGKYGTEQ